MSKCGLYYQLVKSQKQDEEEEKKDSTLSSRDLQSRRNRKEQKSPGNLSSYTLDAVKITIYLHAACFILNIAHPLHL